MASTICNLTNLSPLDQNMVRPVPNFSVILTSLMWNYQNSLEGHTLPSVDFIFEGIFVILFISEEF